MPDKENDSRKPDRDRRKGVDDEEFRGHRAGEQFQPGHTAHQGAEEVMIEERDPEEEGRTNVDVHEPRSGKAKPNRGQALRPRRRDAESK